MIQVQNLTKYYRNLCAVDGINFEVRSGEILGLLGPNGAGKTTTLRMLTGFLQPTSGVVLVKDYRFNTDALAIKRMLGYLPESAPLYREMLVLDYLAFVADIRSLPTDDRGERIRSLADLCGIEEVMHQPIGELSKGYKQRVGLAHAMINDPDILVLDEPTSGLDPNQIVEIRDIIRRIGKRKTIILSTHILSEAEATCDRIVIIDRGKIVADDTTARLKEAAGDTNLIHLSLQGTDFDAARELLGALPGIDAIDRVEGPGDQLQLRLTVPPRQDLRAEVYRRIKATDWLLLDFHQESRTLETVFRELTKEN
jgi:ABC-2 type transport system ATP-binding protein